MQKIKIHLFGFYSLFKEILLVIVGLLVFIPLAFLGVIYTISKHILLLDYSMKRQIQPVLRNFILSVDGFANATAGELLNDVFKIKQESKLRYGKWYQTISAVTGLLKVYANKDSWLRKMLKILGKNHCEEAITEMEHEYYIKEKNR